MTKKNDLTGIKNVGRSALLFAAIAGLTMTGQNAEASAISEAIETGPKELWPQMLRMWLLQAFLMAMVL